MRGGRTGWRTCGWIVRQAGVGIAWHLCTPNMVCKHAPLPAQPAPNLPEVITGSSHEWGPPQDLHRVNVGTRLQQQLSHHHITRLQQGWSGRQRQCLGEDRRRKVRSTSMWLISCCVKRHECEGRPVARCVICASQPNASQSTTGSARPHPARGVQHGGVAQVGGAQRLLRLPARQRVGFPHQLRCRLAGIGVVDVGAAGDGMIGCSEGGWVGKSSTLRQGWRVATKHRRNVGQLVDGQAEPSGMVTWQDDKSRILQQPSTTPRRSAQPPMRSTLGHSCTAAQRRAQSPGKTSHLPAHPPAVPPPTATPAAPAARRQLPPAAPGSASQHTCSEPERERREATLSQPAVKSAAWQAVPRSAARPACRLPLLRLAAAAWQGALSMLGCTRCMWLQKRREHSVSGDPPLLVTD